MEEELKEICVGRMSELKEINKGSHRKKGKEVKNWQRTKFYQRQFLICRKGEVNNEQYSVFWI